MKTDLTYDWSCTEATLHLMSLSDKKLSKRLGIVRSQIGFAYSQRNDAALINLQSQEAAIINARLEKF
jgi:hypothetical protein